MRLCSGEPGHRRAEPHTNGAVLLYGPALEDMMVIAAARVPRPHSDDIALRPPPAVHLWSSCPCGWTSVKPVSAFSHRGRVEAMPPVKTSAVQAGRFARPNRHQALVPQGRRLSFAKGELYPPIGCGVYCAPPGGF